VTRITRRIVSAVLVVLLGLSSVESLWGDDPAAVPASAEVVGTAGPESTSEESPRPDGEPEEDCPCLCDCACVNAQRVVAPEAALSPHFDLLIASPLPRTASRAPRSVDPEPHLRPPVR
jgi:hypothetical protein